MIVPHEQNWEGADLENAREVRLRAGQPVMVSGPGGIWRGSHILSPAELPQAAQALTQYSLATGWGYAA